MAKARGQDSVPFDDIELLNIHRYPESHASSVVAHIRNSKACQKRLEELLKALPGKGGKRRQLMFEDTESPVPQSTSPATPGGRPVPVEAGGIWQSIRKALS